MPSVLDLLAVHLESTSEPLFARQVYGPDFARIADSIPAHARPVLWGMRNSYARWSDGDPFLPYFMGSIKRVHTEQMDNEDWMLCPISIDLTAPPVHAGHPLDVLFWDQLVGLRRVIAVDAADVTPSIWDVNAYRNIQCEVSSITPWATGPSSDSRRSAASNDNQIRLTISPDIVTVNATPGRLFSPPLPLSTLSSTNSVPESENMCYVKPGDLVIAKCELRCDYERESAAYCTRPLVTREYSLHCNHLSIVA
ncbi:hypothetical protein C8R46DRAFT_1225645 [Mycena filopes]|nr:hypothetical protein C8R46DRAFT_1225645 [Mycena filopes]